jgi:hypothetical protein
MRFRAIAPLILISGCLAMLAACMGLGGNEGGSPTAEQGRWSTVAPLPTPRSETAVAQTGDVMYVIGGYTPETKSSELNSSYDPATDAWTELAPLPKGLNHIAATSVGEKVYAFGGFAAQNRNAVDSAYAYDPATDAWSALDHCPPYAGRPTRSRSTASCTSLVAGTTLPAMATSARTKSTIRAPAPGAKRRRCLHPVTT